MRNIMQKKNRRSKKKLSIVHTTIDSDSICSDLNKLDMSSSNQITFLCYEGKLSKYTNIVKGWQYRWFILDPKTGVLSYFLSERDRWKRPKGRTSLASAIILPSDEDCNSFTINSIFGTCLRLRAENSVCRQDWVNRLRAVSQMHSSCSVNRRRSESASDRAWDTLAPIKERIFRAEECRLRLSEAIDDLPTKGRLHHLDPDLLTLKALSYAVIMSMNQCLDVLSRNAIDNRIGSFSSNIDNLSL